MHKLAIDILANAASGVALRKQQIKELQRDRDRKTDVLILQDECIELEHSIRVLKEDADA